jgi:C1A family cysteine protease
MRLLLSALVLCAVSFGAEAPKFTGLVIPKDWAKTANYDKALIGVPLPTEFDLRVKFAGLLPPVKSQGSCGSCYAFAQTAAFETAIAIAEGKYVDLAEQELVSCDTQSYGCNGGFFTGLEYQMSMGQTHEAEFPYTASNQRCKKTVSHDFKSVQWGYIGEAHRAPTVDEIKTYIYAGNSVAVTVNADRAMMNYRGGVLGANGCAQGQPNHMVNLEGWADQNGKNPDGSVNKGPGYWIMRNSWGTSYGEKGYARVKYGCNAIGGIAAYTVFKP